MSSFAKLKLTAVRGHLNQTGNLIFIWDKMFLKMKLEEKRFKLLPVHCTYFCIKVNRIRKIFFDIEDNFLNSNINNTCFLSNEK